METNPIIPEHMQIAAKFMVKFKALGLSAELQKVDTGPVVSTYHFKPHSSIPIKKILDKEEDFALAAEVEAVTIQRIKGELVIFVPNKERVSVEYKNYLHWFLSDKKTQSYHLPIGVGVDYLGNNTAFDLTEWPHLLMAGSTGSGKSVFQSGLICGLATSKSPDDLHIMLVDTKQLDLPLFRGLKHVKRICTTLQDYLVMMDDMIKECRSRLQRLTGAACRNIREYHGMGEEMPYIVVVIDEFADLLEQDKIAKKEKYSVAADYPKVDDQLKQLVQIGRAAGIHIIAGTQRTSTKIINGDIKANFPCRLSLQLPTRFDSVTILGEDGAETLLGRGDMLISLPNSQELKRFHGPFVEQGDIARIIDGHNEIRENYTRMRELSSI